MTLHVSGFRVRSRDAVVLEFSDCVQVAFGFCLQRLSLRWDGHDGELSRAVSDALIRLGPHGRVELLRAIRDSLP